MITHKELDERQYLALLEKLDKKNIEGLTSKIKENIQAAKTSEEFDKVKEEIIVLKKALKRVLSEARELIKKDVDDKRVSERSVKPEEVEYYKNERMKKKKTLQARMIFSEKVSNSIKAILYEVAKKDPKDYFELEKTIEISKIIEEAYLRPLLDAKEDAIKMCVNVFQECPSYYFRICLMREILSRKEYDRYALFVKMLGSESRYYNFNALIADFLQGTKSAGWPTDLLEEGDIFKWVNIALNLDNVVALKSIQQYRPEEFKKALETLTHDERLKLTTLFKYEDEKFLTQCMMQFTQGFGKVSWEGGLLTLAQTKQRKKYNVDPTLIFDDGKGTPKDPFYQYFKQLKTVQPPIRDRFIISDIHWMTGEIEIKVDGSINVLLIDPAGEQIKGEIGFGHHFISALAESFPEAKKNIYFSKITRQFSAEGCSVFALDDVRRLFTVDRRLPTQYEKSGLFGFLEDHKIKDKNNQPETLFVENTPVTYVQLPLSLMGTMQSRKFLSEHLPSRTGEEQALPVNKRGETAKAAFEKELVLKGDKHVNAKLERKLKKMQKYNFNYLINTPKDQVEREMAFFRVENLAEKLRQKKEVELINKETEVKILAEPPASIVAPLSAPTQPAEAPTGASISSSVTHAASPHPVIFTPSVRSATTKPGEDRTSEAMPADNFNKPKAKK